MADKDCGNDLDHLYRSSFVICVVVARSRGIAMVSPMTPRADPAIVGRRHALDLQAVSDDDRRASLFYKLTIFGPQRKRHA